MKSSRRLSPDIDLLAKPRNPSACLVEIEERREREWVEAMKARCERVLKWVQLKLFEESA